MVHGLFHGSVHGLVYGLGYYLVSGYPNVLDSTEIYTGVDWSILESAVLPYETVWSQISNFDEKILLFGLL